MPDESTLDLLLEARMQQLAARRRQAAAPPDDLRHEVFRTLDLLDTIGEVGALFTGTLLGTAAEFIDLIEDPEGGLSSSSTTPPNPAADDPRR